MSIIGKKMPIFLCLLFIWITASGFAELDGELSVGIDAVMDELTDEDIERMRLEEEWADVVLADVQDYVTVRSEPNAEAEALGRMFQGDGGEILEELDGWTKIASGNLEGYVNNEYLAFGMEAYEMAQDEIKPVATSLTGGLRIRSEANMESKILKNVEEGAELDVIEDGETPSDWVHVQYAEEKTGYVSAEYVIVEYKLGEAMTMEEIEKKEAEEKREKLKQQRDAFKANGNEVVLLAALIQAEGGNQPYEGQVAIGAVVMNRVRAGRYGPTIADVIYAPGQFSVVHNGAMNKYLGGPKASCMQAAQEAINGYTPIGGFTHFKNARSSVSGDHIVIGNHVFY